MSRARKRAERIREEIDISRVLSDYGYTVTPGYGGEEQFSCDLHGDGNYSMPSARVYPDSNSWYCFACDRARDAIETTREKEGLGFWDAIKLIENRYGLPRLPWDDEDREDWEERKRRQVKAVDEVAAALDPSRTYEDDRRQVVKLLESTTVDRDLPVQTVAMLWEAYDKIVYLVSQERITEAIGRTQLARIRQNTLDKLGASA